nr:5080_t:CDS:2 [Entrophospora candida]
MDFDPIWNPLTPEFQLEAKTTIFGGTSNGEAPPNPLYIFDTTSKSKGHAATLVGEKYLYVYGGRLLPPVNDQNIDEFIDGTDTTEILYLDVSVNFDPKNPAWSLLTADNLIAFHSMSIGGQNNNSLIIFGGMSSGNAPPNPLYIFDTTSKSKSLASKAVTTECTSRVLHTSVTKYDSKVFILGGSPIPVAGNTEVSDALNTLCVYDSLTDVFTVSTSTFANGISHHTSTLLSDDLIYVIGGINNVVTVTSPSLLPMNVINIYDTNLNSWSTKTVLGDNPPQRRGHRAVGTIDKKIIIYGGRNADGSVIYDDVLELDTTTLTWKIIQTEGITKPPGLFDHTMTMVGTNIIITYGFMTTETFYTASNIFILDSTNYTWLETYTPNIPIQPSTSMTPAPSQTSTDISATSSSSSSLDPSPSTNSSNSGQDDSSSSSSPPLPIYIIGIISVAAFIVVLLIIGLIIYVCKRKEKRHNSYFTTPYGLNQPYSPPLTGNLLFNQSPNYLTSNKNTSDRSTSSLPVPPPPLLPPSTLKNKNSSDSSKLTIVDPNDVHRNSPRKQFSIDDYLGNPYQLPSLTLPSTLKNKNSFDSNKLTIDDPNDASRSVDDYLDNPYQPRSQSPIFSYPSSTLNYGENDNDNDDITSSNNDGSDSSYLQLMQANNDRIKASSIATSSIYTPSRSSSTGSSHIGSTRPKIDTQLNSITESGDVTPTKFTTTTSPSSDIIAAINAAAKSDSRSSEEGSFQSPLFRNENLSLRTATRLSKINPNDHVDHDGKRYTLSKSYGLHLPQHAPPGLLGRYYHRYLDLHLFLSYIGLEILVN